MSRSRLLQHSLRPPAYAESLSISQGRTSPTFIDLVVVANMVEYMEWTDKGITHFSLPAAPRLL